jgi:hypothetical protein
MLGELRSATSLIANIYAKAFDVLEGAPLLRGFWIVMREGRCSMALGRKTGVDASRCEGILP